MKAIETVEIGSTGNNHPSWVLFKLQFLVIDAFSVAVWNLETELYLWN